MEVLLTLLVIVAGLATLALVVLVNIVIFRLGRDTLGDLRADPQRHKAAIWGGVLSIVLVVASALGFVLLLVP